jgi:hypothetical protein
VSGSGTQYECQASGKFYHRDSGKAKLFKVVRTSSSIELDRTNLRMDNAQGFSSLQDQIQNALVSTTRTAGQISSEDLSFQRSLNPAIATALDEQSARLLALTSSLLNSAASISELEAPRLQDVDDVDISWRGVVDVVDSLLEKADTFLDEYTGVIKRKTPPTSEQVKFLYRNRVGFD